MTFPIVMQTYRKDHPGDDPDARFHPPLPISAGRGVTQQLPRQRMIRQCPIHRCPGVPILKQAPDASLNSQWQY